MGAPSQLPISRSNQRGGGERSGRRYGVPASVDDHSGVGVDATGVSHPAIRIPSLAVGRERTLAPHDRPAAPAATSLTASAAIDTTAPLTPELGMPYSTNHLPLPVGGGTQPTPMNVIVGGFARQLYSPRPHVGVQLP